MKIYVRDLLRTMADSPAQYNVLEHDIAQGRTVVEKFIAAMREAYPPAP